MGWWGAGGGSNTQNTVQSFLPAGRAQTRGSHSDRWTVGQPLGHRGCDLSRERRVRVRGGPPRPGPSRRRPAGLPSSSIRLHHEPMAELQRKQDLLRHEVRCPLDKGSSQAGAPAVAVGVGTRAAPGHERPDTPVASCRQVTASQRAWRPRGARTWPRGPVASAVGRHQTPQAWEGLRAHSSSLPETCDPPGPWQPHPGAFGPAPGEPRALQCRLLCATRQVWDVASFPARGTGEVDRPLFSCP